jgi:hypothetical protein
MTEDREQQGCEIIQFSRRPVPPRACVVENRIHVRMFLADMLDEMGFIAREADTSVYQGNAPRLSAGCDRTGAARRRT